MHNIITRRPRTNEISALLHIWNNSFDSPDEGAEFFSQYFDPNLSLVVCLGEMPVAMGHLLPIGKLVSDQLSAPCAMIYAIAALPGHRKRGFGTAISKGLISNARSLGFPAIALCPADEGLFEFYKSRTEMREWFYVNELCFTAPPASTKQALLEPISAQKYAKLREVLLENTPHVEFNQRALEYQSTLCNLYGGGLYQIKTSIGISCAVVERQSDDFVCIKELLTDAGFSNQTKPTNRTTKEQTHSLSSMISAIATKYPAAKYEIRMPAETRAKMELTGYDTFQKRKFAMLAMTPEVKEMTEESIDTPWWFGLAFD